MKYIIASVFILISVILISFTSFNPLMITTQETGSQNVYVNPGFSGGFIAAQEITMKKDYLTGISLLFKTNNRENTDENLILVMDENYQVIYRETFLSAVISDYKYFPVNLKRSIFIGKGKSIWICHYSMNGDENNHVSIVCNPYSALGKLYLSAVTANDILGAVPKKTTIQYGSFVLKTYESNFNTSVLIKLILFFLAAMVGLCIIFSKAVFLFIGRWRLNPERIFAVLAAVFGLILVFLTPPFQVPDEQSHFNRAYQVSEFDLLRLHQTVPLSLLHLDSLFQKMKFNSDEKTFVREIFALTNIKLNPDLRLPKSTNICFVPYIPSAIGIFAGRILNCPPLILLYLGRLFNLVFSVIIIYFAIKIIPVHKWIFFMLALMPMALFMRSSLSYDVMKLNLSFFLFALILKFAYSSKSSLTNRNLIVLFTVAIFLALSNMPYYVLTLSFLLIPIDKLGSLKKYIFIFLALMILPGLVNSMFSYASEYFGARNEIHNDPSYGITAVMTTANSGDQISYILGNIPQYIIVLLRTTFVYRGESYITGFVGNLGWLDTPMPSFLIVLFLTMLLVTAICDSKRDVNPGWKARAIMFTVFILAGVIIETALYVYASPYKGIIVESVQGRYFIFYAPAFFFLFYNAYISRKLNLALSLQKDELTRVKSKGKPDLNTNILEDEQIFSRTLNLIVVGFIIFTLFFTVYILAYRYYYIGETIVSVNAKKNAEKEAKLNIDRIQDKVKAVTRNFDLAKTAVAADKLDSAACYLENVLMYDPKHVTAAHNLALLYFKMNQKKKALQVIEKMKENGIKTDTNLLNLFK